MSTPEQSLDLKTYRAGFQKDWGIAERQAHVDAHPAEATEHLEWIRENPRPEEKRRKDRGEQTGVRHVTGRDGKVYPGTARLSDQVWTDILVMHRDGISMRKIAAAIGCAVGTVHRVAKSYVLVDAAA